MLISLLLSGNLGMLPKALLFSGSKQQQQKQQQQQQHQGTLSRVVMLWGGPAQQTGPEREEEDVEVETQSLKHTTDQRSDGSTSVANRSAPSTGHGREARRDVRTQPPPQHGGGASSRSRD
ncbi:hypothetical protein CTA1_2925 [Colletotrichum tanaceti]|uniref:Uncharacterized protein n=1 Tax=Colletotrichum tanaceti TaxID=1306861 RepID=A0A4U6XK93_9PEZI|nr:hypothetical protein CTA1_2925 [Colletotrichum tanaceti]